MPISATVKDIATRKLIVVDENDSVYDAVVMMTTEDIGAIVVASVREPVGILTERDLMKKVVLEERDPKNTKVGEVMSKPLITIRSDASFGEATQLMQERKIRRLLVEDDGKIVGIITQRDLERGTLDSFSALTGLA
jgi:CBS domain-containing protein